MGSKTLTGIACSSVDSMIKFCRLHIIVNFISKEDKDYQNDVIGCIFDDVIPGLKNELSLFMKETKMAAKKQEDADSINKKKSISKSKPITISPPIIDSSNDKSTVTQDNNNNNVEVDSEEDSINRTSSDKYIDVSSGTVKETKKNKDDDEEDSSDESNVMLPESMPLTIGIKTVNTQGIALSVHIDDKKYSNSMLHKKHCMLKKVHKRVLRCPTLLMMSTLMKTMMDIFMISLTRMSLGRLVQVKIFVLLLILGICIDQVQALMLTFQNYMQRVFIVKLFITADH